MERWRPGPRSVVYWHTLRPARRVPDAAVAGVWPAGDSVGRPGVEEAPVCPGGCGDVPRQWGAVPRRIQGGDMEVEDQPELSDAFQPGRVCAQELRDCGVRGLSPGGAVG